MISIRDESNGAPFLSLKISFNYMKELEFFEVQLWSSPEHFRILFWGMGSLPVYTESLDPHKSLINLENWRKNG